MAGRGPAPKLTRQRRNAPALGEWVILEQLSEPVVAELGSFAGEWDAGSVSLWEIWRHDPVSALWSEADVHFALDTLRIRQEALMRSPNEVRLRMESLGLTPKGRRDLRLRIAQDEQPDEGEQAKPKPARKLPAAV